jgi:PAS domain S-box-containing protein
VENKVPFQTYKITKDLLIGLAAGLIGFGINCLPLPLFPGIHLVFGSAVTLVFAARRGVATGGVAGLVAGAATWWLWNQPFPSSALLLGVEGAWVGWLCRRAKSPRQPLYAALTYWLLIGGWSNLLLQHYGFHLPWQTSIVIALRSLVNGFFCALIAEALLAAFYYVRQRKGRPEETFSLSLSAVLRLVLLLGVCLPTTCLVVSFARYTRTEMVERAQAKGEANAVSVQRAISGRMSTFRRAISLVADVIQTEQIKFSETERLNRLLEATRREHPELAGMYVADERARTVAFSPLRNQQGEYLVGREYSDRRYYQDLLKARGTVFSGVYQARGGMTTPTAAIAVPLLRDNGEVSGFALGWFRMEMFHEMAASVAGSKNGDRIMITDAEGYLVADSALSSTVYTLVSSVADNPLYQRAQGAAEGRALVTDVPSQQGRSTAGATFADNRWLAWSTVPEVGWRVLSAKALRPVEEELATFYLQTLVALAGFLIVAALAAQLVGRRLSRPLVVLEASARRLASGDLKARPEASRALNREVRSLTEAFTQMAASLDHSWTQQRALFEQVARGKLEWETTFDSMSDGVFVFDQGGRLVRVNLAAARMVGSEITSLIGKHCCDMLAGLAPGQCLVTEVLSTGQHVAREGTPRVYGRPLYVTSEPVSRDGRITGAICVARDLSELRGAEEALRESEDRYRDLVEHSHDLICTHDLEGRVLSVNEAAVKLLGYDRETLLKRNIREILLPEFRSEFDNHIVEVQKNGVTKGVMSVQTSTGERRIWEFTNTLRTEGVPIPIVRGVAHDVTERVRAEAERRLIAEIIQGVIATANLEELLKLIHHSIGKLLYAENCFVTLHDQTTDLMHFVFWVDKFDPIPSPRPVGKGFSSYVLRTGHPLRLTEELKSRMYASGEVEKSGSNSASWLGVPLRTPSRTIGVLVIQHYEDEGAYSQRDLEFLYSVGDQIALAIERKRAEQALREAERRAIVEYERLLERIASLAQALGTARELKSIFRALLDFALISTPCNGIFVSLYDPERNVRTPVYAASENKEEDLTLLALMPMTDSPNSRAIATGEVILTCDYQAAMAGQPDINIGLERDPRLPQSSLVAPMSVMGKVIGAIEVQSVERAAFSQEHATAMRMAANLAAIAIENVRLFEQEREKEEQLLQSQKLESVGQLAGGIAHDFNNLLTVIGGYSEIMLRRFSQDDPLRRNTEEIKKAAERASSLTRQLLAFSRKQVLQPKVFDLNSLVTDVSKMLRRLIGEDIEFITLLRPEAGLVNADPGQIEQVLMNLVVNARDAMPRGGKITIETANVQLDKAYADMHIAVQPGKYVMLIVSDTGLGMDAEMQDHIFEPFFTTKEVGKGTGLGLSTVYGIVKQSGGNIWVYSGVGHGTTFKIYLPLAEEEVGRRKPAEPAAPRGTETILLVEDEGTVRKLARAILEENGYHVLEAANGEEALPICEQHCGDIHLMLTDVVMPLMSGRELANRIETICPHLPVLYMSGYTDDAIVHHGVLDPGTPFLEKPFTPDALARKVREVLDTIPVASRV